MRLTSKDQRLAARYIPKNAHCVTLTDDYAAYCYQQAGRVGVLCYRGSSSKAEEHVIYRDIDQATEAIAAFLTSVRDSLKRKAEYRAAKKAWINPLQVGNILYTSWGYDQTNVDFYVVTRVSGKRTWVRAIASDSEDAGFMSEHVWPKMPIEMCGEETLHIAQPISTNLDAGGVCLNINGHSAWLEQGRTHYASHYA